MSDARCDKYQGLSQRKKKQVHYYFVSKSGHAYGLHVSAFELSRCMKWTENTIEHGR